MKKAIFYWIAISCLMVYGQGAVAQVVDTGRESAKGELDFTAMAAYEKAHPGPKVIKAVENDEDNDEHPAPGYVDPTKMFGRRLSPSFTPSLPISPAPTDTFESTLDNGLNIPPDTHGAVDLNYCVTSINTSVTIQTKAGGAVSSVSLDGFWSSVLSSGTFDPRVHYDPYTNRWIVVTVGGANSTTSCILIAVSKTSDPTGAWWTYKVTADGTGINWLDFPDVGYNGKWLTITGNLFAITGGAFNGAKVYAFNKANLLSGVGATYTSFLHTSDFTICPALTYDATEGSMFLVESYDGGNPGGGLMQLWKITGAVGSETMTSVGFPVATGFNWQQTAYAAAGPTAGADFAPQAGTSNLLQTNDDRVDQVVFMNGNLWFAHTIFLPYSSSLNPTRASVQWWQIDTTGTPLQIGTVDDPTGTNFYAFPTITPNTSDDALVGFAAFSGTTYPSSAYALRLHTDAADAMRPLQIYRHGQANYYKTFSGTKNRWGDYSGACIDPVNMTDFWTIQEATAKPSSTWDTWWAHVKICSPPDVITGSSAVCVGATITLSDDTLGGTWTSSNTVVASIGTGGIVTGASAGTSTITYTVNGGCTATKNVTVNALPGAITGSTAVCTSLTTNLSDAGGGTWTSNNSSVATIGLTTGVVTGNSTGTAVITYTLGSGCINTTTVTVSTLPAAITGVKTLCAGATTALTDAGGGTWASSNTSVATVGVSSGVVNGLTAGSSTISYSLGAGCTVITGVTVNLSPLGITGSPVVCSGASINLTDATGGGAWTSSNTSVATVVSGVVTGGSSGTSVIAYTLTGGCNASVVVTVNPVPGPITGTLTVCQGATTSLTDGVGGGGWTSSNTSVATVVSGAVTGLTPGTASIVYTLGGGCSTSTVVTVNPAPAAITGTSTVCVGLTTILSDTTPLGVWTSSNTSVATVAGGVVTGMATGSSVIAYTIAGGCSAVATVVVSTSAPPITGVPSVCAGLTTALSDAGGGTWTSTNTGVATVGLGSGIVTGASVGTANIIYSLGAGCTASVTVTVNLSASAITGTAIVCAGATTNLSDPSFGGTWSSSNTSVATVLSGSGTVTGVSAGTTTITYSIGIGCTATTVVTVMPSPSAISGASSVCLGLTATLSDAGGGTWTSSNTAVATIGISSGVVNGLSLGTTLIAYTVAGCSATLTLPVVPLPILYTVTGGGTLCAGGAGVHIGLSGSELGVNYQLYNGPSLVTSLPGTTSSLDYGPITTAGTYTIVAVGAGCSDNMVGAAVVTVNALATPSVSITASPGDTVCATGHVTFTAVPAFGGPSPFIQWSRNSVNVGTGPTYSPSPLPSDGDLIGCTMTSDYACLLSSAPVGASLVIHIQAVSKNYDSVKVTTSSIEAGQVDTFVAIASHGGVSPAYQWYVDNISVPGATDAIYVTSALVNGQKVKCLITSSDQCTSPQVAFTNTITVMVASGISQVVNNAGEFTLVPNPNKGEFNITGTLKDPDNGHLGIVVTNMLGQTVYRKTAVAQNGTLDEHIILQPNIAAGMYIVKITSGAEFAIFHIVVER